MKITRYLTKHFFPNKDIEPYATQIISSKQNYWNKITDEILLKSLKYNIDPYIALAIYYVESFYRPPWFTFIEYKLYQLGLMKNPSIGPFQVRISHLKHKGCEHLLEDSLDYIREIIIKCNLTESSKKENFRKLGRIYNLDENYGEVLYRIWKDIKKENWVLTK